jgi:peptidoglycan/xylan/chitin deacetylase (PgdA/CDA1 family)
MIPDLTRAVLVWDPEDLTEFDLDPSAFRAMGLQTLEVSYARLASHPNLVERIADTVADAVVFTRHSNTDERVSIGPLLARLRMGYTTISGIDKEWARQQTKECISDFLAGHGRVDLPPVASRPDSRDRGPAKGTFSIILDFEQLGCARFGVPRLLPILESAGIRATFFVTGFMAWLYPEVLERISAGGHEIGIHGSMHEFLRGRHFEDQLGRISENVRSLARFGTVTGANFLYRMDEVSPAAMVGAGLKYVVLFRQHAFYRSRFIPASCSPRALRTSAGDITMIPIQAETYAGDYRNIKGMIDSGWKTAVREGVNHISVLMHPFKDGRLDRLPLTKQILKHLTEDLQLEGAPLNSLPLAGPVDRDAVRVGYRWHGYELPKPEQLEHHPRTNSWWTPIIYHSKRAENLVDALNRVGCPAVLSAEVSETAKDIRIFPETAAGDAATVFSDPIGSPRRTALAVKEVFGYATSFTVAPPSNLMDLWGFFIFHVPRNWEEMTLTLGKVWRRLRGKLSGGSQS